MKRGIMIGRFQPFHNGHLELAKQILSECGELVVAIGSAQFNFIPKDPFTAGERIMMIHDALAEAGIDLGKCYIVPFANDESNARWLAYLRSMVPPFDAIYSGNDFVKYLAVSQDSGVTLRSPKFIEKEQYNGTNIRRLIAEGGDWQRLVPPAVAKIIEQAGGVKRMQVLANSDSDPQKW